MNVMLESIKRELEKPFGVSVDRGRQTAEIKRRLTALGKENNLYVCATVEGSDCTEWLFDVCWLKFDGHKDTNFDYEHLGSVVLACESELGNENEVIDDFHKLLQSTATYKVLIFRSPDDRNLVQYFERNIAVFSPKTDSTFLFVNLRSAEQTMTFHTVQVSRG